MHALWHELLFGLLLSGLALFVATAISSWSPAAEAHAKDLVIHTMLPQKLVK